MPQTVLYVAEAAGVSGKGWMAEGDIVGPADTANALYASEGAESATMSLTFDTAEIPANAVIGEVTVRLWGTWEAAGEPAPVSFEIGTAPPLEFMLDATPGVHELGDGSGWGMTPATLNALMGTLSITSSEAGVFGFDAVEVKIDWEVPARSLAKKGSTLGMFGFAL